MSTENAVDNGKAALVPISALTMDPVLLPIVLRLVERIASVAVGGLMIYLGYRLFSQVRGKAESSGDFSLGGGRHIKLSKVGPGVFFALFGTGLIIFSITRGIEVSTRPGAGREAGATGAPAQPEITFRGASSIPETSAVRDERRGLRAKDLAALNRAAEKVRPRLDAAEKEDFERALRQAKLSLMEPLWGEDWGDIVEFSDWIEHPGQPPPDDIAQAAGFFSQK